MICLSVQILSCTGQSNFFCNCIYYGLNFFSFLCILLQCLGKIQFFSKLSAVGPKLKLSALSLFSFRFSLVLLVPCCHILPHLSIVVFQFFFISLTLALPCCLIAQHPPLQPILFH